jgi:hypothetical protein
MKKIIVCLVVFLCSANIISQTKYSFYNAEETIVKDNVTGLLWTKCNLNEQNLIPSDDCSNDINYPAAMTWNQALSACYNLTYGGRSDWRLPTIRELVSILHHKEVKQADPGVDEVLLDINFFSNNFHSDGYRSNNWTSTETLKPGYAYFGKLKWGTAQWDEKTKLFAVRCVAGPVSD